MSLRAQPWWTDADQSELEQLVWEFVQLGRQHKGLDGYRRCPRCEVAIGGWCETLATIWEDVEAWLASRRMRSRAEWLRRRQREHDLAGIREELRDAS